MLKAFWKKIDILKKNNVPIRQVISTTVIFFSNGLFGKKISIEIQDLTITW